MSSLFDANKNNLRKLFNYYEKEGFLKFTDLLKLCSSTRIFPDLLSSADLHKILIDVAKDPETSTISQNISFAQFEHLLKIITAKAFHEKSGSEQEKQFFNHLKQSAGIRHSIDFETGQMLKKPMKKVPKLNIESAKQQSEATKSTRRHFSNVGSTSNLKASSFLFRSSPSKHSVERKNMVHYSSIITPRLAKEKETKKLTIKPLFTERNIKKSSRACTSLTISEVKVPKNKIQKLSEVIQKYQKLSIEKEIKHIKSQRFIKFLQILHKKLSFLSIQQKLSFKIWKLITKKPFR